MKKVYIIFFTLLLFAGTLFLSEKKEVFSKESIVLGQSAALSGPTKVLGESMRKGALSFFDSKEDIKISLISYDDKYEPEITKKNINKLITEDKVFSIFGVVGTPTSKVAYPLTLEHNIPYLTPFTGAEFLRSPVKKNVINLRNSYFSETKALVDFLVKDLQKSKIGVLYQNDSYGKAGLMGVELALEVNRLPLMMNATYKRNTLSLSHALFELKNSDVDSIIIIGAYKPSAEFIKRAKKEGYKDLVFCNISFVGSKALVEVLGEDTENVYISQVVPLPWDGSNESVKEYQKLFAKKYPNEDFGFVSLEGFLAAKLVYSALKKLDATVTREEFIHSLESIEAGIFKDIKTSLSKSDHQAIDSVFITKYENEQFIQIKEMRVDE